MSLERRIELIGLCGAGKSTFLELLAPQLLQKLPMRLQASTQASKPALAMVTLRMVGDLLSRGSHGWAFLCRRANWWLPLKLAYRRAQTRQSDAGWTIHSDTGLLQPIVSFVAEHNPDLNPVPHELILDALPLPAAVIYVRAEPEVALARYIARAKASCSVIPRGDLRSTFDEASRLLSSLMEDCKRRGVHVVLIESDETRSEAAASRVAAQLAAVIGGNVL